MDFTIFYAWQSDVDQKVNRYFIRNALERSIKELQADASIDDSPSLDHDTKDVPGTPDIFTTILEKIDACGVFLADVTPVSATTAGKQIGNPNVMIELGYALAKIGDRRIVLVFNDASGTPAQLPFDLARKRWPIAYNLAPGSKPTADQERALASAIGKAIRGVLESGTVANLPQRAQARWNSVRRRLVIKVVDTYVATFNATHHIMRLVTDPTNVAPFDTAQLFIRQVTDSAARLRDALPTGLSALPSDMAPSAVAVMESAQQVCRTLTFFAVHHDPARTMFDVVGIPPWAELEEMAEAGAPIREAHPDAFGDIRVPLLTVDGLRKVWDKAQKSSSRLCYDFATYVWRVGRTPLVADASSISRLHPPSPKLRMSNIQACIFYE